MKKTILGNLLFLLFVLFLSACNNNNDINIIEESGILETKELILSSKVTGSIFKILYDEGAKVKQGDTLLIIEHRNLDIKLKQAMASCEMAKAKYDLAIKGTRKEDLLQSEQLLKQTEVVFKQAEKDKSRYNNLLENKTISQKQFEDISLKFEIAKAQYISAKENFEKLNNITRPEELRQAKANYEYAIASAETIQENINDCFVRAPIDGFITKQFQEKGEVVTMLSSLLKIADLKSIEANIYVSEMGIGKVKLGQKVSVKIDSFPDKEFSGTVKFISPEAEFTPKNIQTKDERTKLVFKVKVSIKNDNLELKPGLPADIKIILD